MSDVANVKYGAPRGSKLCPLLFIIFVNDCPNNIAAGSSRLYADDIVITVTAASQIVLEQTLTLALDEYINWMNRNDLTLNIQKTKIICFGTSQPIPQLANVNIEYEGN